LSTTTGSVNTANGAFALFSNIDGERNNAVGYQALFTHQTGDDNNAIGTSALFSNTSGSGNTAVGDSALRFNTTGAFNTAIGAGAGSSSITGSNNVYVGAAMFGVAGESDACYIKSIFGQTSAGGAQVFINSNNKLGTMTSSKRFKEEIIPMDKASEALFTVKPVTFHYKKEIDPAGTPQFGLVAEDVEKVNPSLVVRDKRGKPYSVRYDQVNAMLLNEFLKEHETLEEVKKEIAALTTTVKEQAAQIQRVSARMQMSKPSAKEVTND
jgi:trimeric autotransporter adhesin